MVFGRVLYSDVDSQTLFRPFIYTRKCKVRYFFQLESKDHCPVVQMRATEFDQKVGGLIDRGCAMLRVIGACDHVEYLCYAEAACCRPKLCASTAGVKEDGAIRELTSGSWQCGSGVGATARPTVYQWHISDVDMSKRHVTYNFQPYIKALCETKSSAWRFKMSLSLEMTSATERSVCVYLKNKTAHQKRLTHPQGILKHTSS